MPLTLWCSFFENTKQDLLLFIQRKISSQKFPNDKGNKILFYLWAQGDEVLSGDSHEFITITNQSEQDTRDRPLWRSGRFFTHFPRQPKTLLWLSLNSAILQTWGFYTVSIGLKICVHMVLFGLLTIFCIILQVYFYHVSFRLQEVFMVRKLMWFNWQQIILDRWLWTVIVYGL